MNEETRFSIFKSPDNFYLIFFCCYSLYVCYYLRYTSPIGGLPAIRSYFVGFSLSYCSKVLYGYLVKNNIRQLLTYDIIKYFSMIWLSMNFTPFDVIFKLINYLPFTIILQILSTIGCNVFFSETLRDFYDVYPGEYIKALFISTLCFSFPVMLDFLDSFFFGEKRIYRYDKQRKKATYFMLYPFHYIERIFVFGLAETVASQPILFPKKYLLEFDTIIPFFAFLSVLLSIFDLLSHKGAPFAMKDICFLKLARACVTYYPRNN